MFSEETPFTLCVSSFFYVAPSRLVLLARITGLFRLAVVVDLGFFLATPVNNRIPHLRY